MSWMENVLIGTWRRRMLIPRYFVSSYHLLASPSWTCDEVQCFYWLSNELFCRFIEILHQSRLKAYFGITRDAIVTISKWRAISIYILNLWPSFPCTLDQARRLERSIVSKGPHWWSMRMTLFCRGYHSCWILVSLISFVHLRACFLFGFLYCFNTQLRIIYFINNIKANRRTTSS